MPSVPVRRVSISAMSAVIEETEKEEYGSNADVIANSVLHVLQMVK